MDDFEAEVLVRTTYNISSCFEFCYLTAICEPFVYNKREPRRLELYGPSRTVTERASLEFR
jgi:hypothetical protein